MKRIKYILYAAVFGATFSACSDFGDINVDPNKMSTKESSYFMLGAEQYVPYFSMNATYNPWVQTVPGYFAEPRNYQFTKFTNSLMQFTTSTLYRIGIQNCDEIIRLNSMENPSGTAGLGGGKSNQIAVAETLRAYFYMHITDATGMTPYFEAGKAQEGITTPQYNTTQEIYTDLDKRLRDAFTKFDTNEPLNSNFEVIYSGNIAKWKKLNASLRMMMAIKLADVDPTVGKERFAKAFADGGLQSDGTSQLGDGDTFAFPYLKENANANLLYTNIVVSGRRDFSPSDFVIDNFLLLNDPRVADIATTVDGKFVGCPFGVQNKEANNYSEFASRYWQQDTPAEIISAAHIKLIQAEAALYGWIGGTPAQYYAEGIREAFANCGISKSMDLSNVNKELAAKLLANTDVAVYLAQPEVALTGDKAGDLKKIAVQRWLNNYLKDGIEGWSDLRRLDWPLVKPAPGTLPNLPLRMMYHPDDYDANRANYDAAVAKQPDKLTTRLWWDVK